LLKPYEHDLDCFQVDKGVGKVGNNSPSFAVPIDSEDNKKNIMNFFRNQDAKKKEILSAADEERKTTIKIETTKDNAPLPVTDDVAKADKYGGEENNCTGSDASQRQPQGLVIKGSKDARFSSDISRMPTKQDQNNSSDKGKKSPIINSKKRKFRDATSNGTIGHTPKKAQNSKITSFFNS